MARGRGWRTVAAPTEVPDTCYVVIAPLREILSGCVFREADSRVVLRAVPRRSLAVLIIQLTVSTCSLR